MRILKKISSLSILIYLLALLTSCAIRVVPSGGTKDAAPPAYVKSLPANYATNFTGNEIEIVFDENIVLSQADRQVIVSPIMQPKPEVSSRRNRLKLKLPESLTPNTTYTINFGNAITDLHEGNAYGGFQFVFSTGSIIDSLKFSGTILHASDLHAEKSVLAMLYSDTDDSCIYKHEPDYYSLTDESGNFTIKNIRPGTYKLFGMKDVSNNLMFEKGADMIAFNTQSLQIPRDSMATMLMFNERDYFPKLKSAKKDLKGRIKIITSAAVPDFDFDVLNKSISKEKCTIIKNLGNDTLFLFYNDSMADSLNMVLRNGSLLLDTVFIELKSKRSASGGRGETALGGSIISNLSGNFLDLGKLLHLNFQFPVQTIDSSKITLRIDSIATSPIVLTFANEHRMQLVMNHNMLPGKRYELSLLPGAFTDLLGNKNDTTIITWNTREPRYYGTFTVTVSNLDINNKIIQLVTEKDEVVAAQKLNSTKIEFNNLEPMLYRVKLIDDNNGNGIFDSGMYYTKRQPERVHYFPKTINIRSNWDVSEEWKF
ncbi:MAG: Ig-like domain-containing protein [Bacteroidetes bacterium]|nr:Ig-like domain-containing protein [Bacteroidota bacterium]